MRADIEHVSMLEGEHIEGSENAHTMYDLPDHVCPPLHFLLLLLFEMVNERIEGTY